ncbi:MAG: molybdate ABC transporter permease subunit [Tepidisphaeraceae bacterium]
MTDLWPAMALSLRVALVATALTVLVGVPLAFFLARRRFVGRSLIEAAITAPLVLPPTVVGYLLIVAVGARSPVGSSLRSLFDGYSLMFNWHGAVLAAAVVALPMLYLPARAAFAGVDRELEDAARQLGANRLQLFFHVSLPLARKGIASGVLLAFARALGEFGATVMVLGHLPRRQTLPISIYAKYEAGELAAATGAVVVLVVISLGVMFVYNRSNLSRQD